MDIYAMSEKMMAMDDTAWQRHANPLSVWSRFSCLPLIALSIWSRDWLGWGALVPLTLALAWTWLNPRAFGPPDQLDNWASKGVMGERVFLNRAQTPVAAHHRRAANILSAVSAAGLAVMIYGLTVLNPWATLCGLIASVLSKLWFVDRMVWVLQDSLTRPAPRRQPSPPPQARTIPP